MPGYIDNTPQPGSADAQEYIMNMTSFSGKRQCLKYESLWIDRVALHLGHEKCYAIRSVAPRSYGDVYVTL